MNCGLLPCHPRPEASHVYNSVTPLLPPNVKTYVIDVNKSHTLEEGAHSPSWPNRLIVIVIIVIVIILVIIILLLAIMNCGLLGCHPRVEAAVHAHTKAALGRVVTGLLLRLALLAGLAQGDH